jgi:hypothetical protein
LKGEIERRRGARDINLFPVAVAIRKGNANFFGRSQKNSPDSPNNH